jgi:hypothetical protein
MGTKIYVLVAYTKDGNIVDLEYSDSLEVTRSEINSDSTKEQLKELGINEYTFKIRDNYYPTN